MCEKGHTADISQGLLSLEICDSSDRAHPGTHATPVTVPPVPSRPQVEVPAHIVGLVIHKPVTIHHMAGMEVGHIEAVLKIRAIIHELHHPTVHVSEPYSEGPMMLMSKKQELRLCLISMNKKQDP